MKKIFLLIQFLFSISYYAQVMLEANGPGNTYELINSKFAPGYDVVENPECVHSQFGRHISEIWDDDLKKYVFEFYIHVNPDNDRCINFDRQRVEIKTYESSPDNLKGVQGETVTYKWRFKLPSGFQPSTSFTHIHQIKAVGGDDGNPIFTLTPRKSNPIKMELIHNNSTKVAVVNLSLFENTWVECIETIFIHPTNGKYSLIIKKVSDGSVILSYSNDKLLTMRADNTFIRPKWGIYRSLDHPEDLRDETIRLNDFSISEGTTGINLNRKEIPQEFILEQNYPNPFNPETQIHYSLPFSDHVSIRIFDLLGKEVVKLVDEYQNAGFHSLTFSNKIESLRSGIYFYRLTTGEFTKTKKMILLQ